MSSFKCSIDYTEQCDHEVLWLPNSRRTKKETSKSKDHSTKKHTRFATLIFVAFIVVLVILYAGKLHTGTANSTIPSTVIVRIENGSGVNPNSPGYSPPKITVVIGINNTVKWVNYDSMPHTVTAVDGSFDSGNLDPGQSFVHTFNTPGTYVYVCIYHHWMEGIVVVISLTNAWNFSRNIIGFDLSYRRRLRVDLLLDLPSWSLTHFDMLFCVACLSSHSLTAFSMAPLRSPFFPPYTVTAANRSLRSTSSERTIYILPKVYGRLASFQ